MTDNQQQRGIANYTALCQYIATTCPDEIREGDNAAGVAIRWHKQLITLRDRLVELESAKADYEIDTEWRDRLDQCERILEMVDELPERAEDFAISVGEKVRDMAKWIEERTVVTEKQKEALDNMQRGCERWLKRD